MKIAIAGPGKMGAALARSWAGAGHEVWITHFRDLEKASALAAETGAHLETDRETVFRQVEVVMLSCPYEGLDAVFDAKAALKGKVVITCVSQLRPDFSGATIGLPAERSISVAEEIAIRLEGAAVSEAFNIVFAPNLNPGFQDFQGAKGSVFFCGDSREANQVTAILIRDCEYEPVHAGSLLTARSLETLASAWVQFAVVGGFFPRVGLRMLKR